MIVIFKVAFLLLAGVICIAVGVHSMLFEHDPDMKEKFKHEVFAIVFGLTFIGIGVHTAVETTQQQETPTHVEIH